MVSSLKKYKISLAEDSKRVQGLEVGDIARRQYFDGSSLIYSLMCVVETGKDEDGRLYFIGALIEGDAPKQGELLDFARVTSLCDEERLGAMYLTASDEEAPYMDVLDGIGKNKSLCYPTSATMVEDSTDGKMQYAAYGDEVDISYKAVDGDRSRVLRVTKTGPYGLGRIGIRQDFYEHIPAGGVLLVSYRIRSSADMTANVEIGQEVNKDGMYDEAVTTEWQYRFHAISVDFSGRYVRLFDLGFESQMRQGDWFEIAELNIIRQQSLAVFADSSQTRIGKMDGVSDSVFGDLKGYGAYLQKLYATRSAHVSGTLTAGDANGFGATFYAGKIHKNVIPNSMQISDVGLNVTADVANPTAMGSVYKAETAFFVTLQSYDWAVEHSGNECVFSFYAYSKAPAMLTVRSLDEKFLGEVYIAADRMHVWHRHSVPFRAFVPKNVGDDIRLMIDVYYDDVEGIDCEDVLYFASPQFETGSEATQYQATDGVLRYGSEYGAWFCQGGVGGTIQNPLLRLNYDGSGSIETRNGSFELDTDGSGHVAHGNIRWDSDGDVTFGEGVTLSWSNLDEEARENLISKSIKITGEDTFVMLGDLTGSNVNYNPASIVLTIEEENFISQDGARRWLYYDGLNWVRFEHETGKSIMILPSASYWREGDSLLVRAEVDFRGATYVDTHTIKREHILGYTLVIVSERGEVFKNGVCETRLRADVYYQGRLVPAEFVEKNFTFYWTKYTLPDLDNEIDSWWSDNGIDRTARSFSLGYELFGSDQYKCELRTRAGFRYDFPFKLG